MSRRQLYINQVHVIKSTNRRYVDAGLVALLLVAPKPCSGTGVACGIESMDDTDRQQALDFLNQLRSDVAPGGVVEYQDYGDYYGPASDMYKLAWNCTLEQTLHDAIKGCPSNPSVPAQFGLSYMLMPSEHANDPLNKALEAWKSQAGDSPPTDTVNNYLLDFGNMVNSKTLTVACSKQACSNGQPLAACIYDQPSLKEGDIMFELGDPCSTNAECTTYTPATCDSARGLCDFNDGSATATAAATTTRTPTTTTTTPFNAHPNPAVNQICPANGHMNDRIRTKALDMINYRRSQLANGLVTKFNGNYLPKAANMIKLVYDCNLEISADTHAKTCSRTNSNPSSNIGETIKYAAFNTTVTTRVEGMAEAVKAWWRKIKTEEVSIGMLVTFKQQHVNAPIRTFTTLAWATTTTIGCGVEKCNGFFFVVCHYQPKGNVVNSVVYQTGEPCTRCPSQTTCATPLCSKRNDNEIA